MDVTVIIIGHHSQSNAFKGRMLYQIYGKDSLVHCLLGLGQALLTVKPEVWRALSTKDRTVTTSLRISETAYKAIQEDAKKQNISINTLANQILLAYAEHDRYLKKFGLLKVITPLWDKLIGAASDEALVEAGKSLGPGAVPSTIISMRGELTIPGVLDWLKRMGTYSNLCDYSEISHEGRISVTMAHTGGPKESILLASYLDSLFRTAGKQIKITQLRDSVTFEV